MRHPGKHAAIRQVVGVAVLIALLNFSQNCGLYSGLFRIRPADKVKSRSRQRLAVAEARLEPAVVALDEHARRGVFQGP
jgi:hypothetical protein